MTGLTADQIIECIANANGVEPAVMRQQIEQALRPASFLILFLR